MSCSCSGGQCQANRANRFTVSLAVTGTTIEGELPLSGLKVASADVRLRRVQ